MSELKREEYWSKFAHGYDEAVDYIVGKAIQQEIIKRLLEEQNIRFIKKCGMPPRYAQTNLSPDEFSSLAEGAGFKIERVQLIGEKTKTLYLKGRKNGLC